MSIREIVQKTTSGYDPYFSGSIVGVRILDGSFETQMNIPPDIFECAYCGTVQAKVRTVVVLTHKIEQTVSKCCQCLAPRTERKKEYV